MPEQTDILKPQNGILVLIGLVAVIGVVGVIYSPLNSIAVMGFCSMIAAQLLNLLQGYKAAAKAEEVANRADIVEVKADKAAAEMADLKKISVATHTLVNSNMELELIENLELKKWKAAHTTNPSDMLTANAAVENAIRKLDEHRNKQLIVDNKLEENK